MTAPFKPWPSRRITPVGCSEALALLAQARHGRIIYTHRALPAVRNAAHIVDGGCIVFRTDANLVVPRPLKPTVITYQADQIDGERHEGWSVSTTGWAEPITSRQDLDIYRGRIAWWGEQESDEVIRVYPHNFDAVRIGYP